MTEPDSLPGVGRHRHLMFCVVTVAASALVAVVGGCAPSTDPTGTTDVAGRDSTVGASRLAPAEADVPADSDQPATPAAGAPRVGRCHTHELSAAFAGGEGFGGGGSQNLVLTNTSRHACRFYGNPGMLLTDAAGHALPTTVDWVGTRVLFTVQPGHSGYAKVTSWTMPHPTDHGAPCDPPAAAVLITPPDETTQLTVKGDWRVCDAGRLEVGVMQATPPVSMNH